MAVALPDAIEKVPTATPSVSKPASGTYGEKAQLNDLKSSLPPMGPGPAPAGGGGPAPMPPPDMQMPGAAPGRPAGAPPGVPGVLLEPGTEGVSAGPSAPPAIGGGVQSAAQARLAMLDFLSSDPSVSQQTRECAQNLLELLITGHST